MKKIYAVCLFALLSLSAFGQEQLTNIPTFYITTNGNAPVVSKEEYLNGELTVVSTNADEAGIDSVKIRGRGNSTWGMPKKAYRLKFYKKQHLLNLPAKEKSWVLLANYADKTLIRNALAFKISQLVELEFTPAVRFVDVVLNGEYLGNYMVTDQVQVKENRVPVEKQKSSYTTEPDITGGYLLEIDGFAGYEPVWFRTNQGLSVTVKYPDDEDINPEQLNYITQYTQTFEDKLFSEKFDDPTAGYRPMIDSASLVNWYIACELTGNSDSFWSTYVYKKRNDPKLYFGPLWDYDIAFNNDYRLGDATQKLMREYAHNPRKWIERIWQDEWFRNVVKNRWQTLVDRGINNTLQSYIDQTANLINQSQTKNFEKWNILEQLVYREVYLFPSYQEGVDYLKKYIGERISFLSSSFNDEVGTTPSDPNIFVPKKGVYYQIINKKSGNAIEVEDATMSNGASLILSKEDKDRTIQQWTFEKSEDEYYFIKNRETELYIMGGGAQGDNITQSPMIETPYALKWHILPTNLENYYGISNQKSGLVLNNNGGGMANGTALIEYNSDIYKSLNAKFRFQEVTNTAVPEIVSKPFKLYYDNNRKTLKFYNLPTGNKRVVVYNIQGTKVKAYSLASEDTIIPFAQYHSGVYIVRIETSHGVLSGKFIVR